MKRLIPFLLMTIILLSSTYALAAGTPDTATSPVTGEPPSHVTITVVMPEVPGEAAKPPALPEVPPETPPAPVIPKLYPVDVTETTENGVRWIVKTYELAAGEDPADIPRGDFERDGFAYALTDIIKKEVSSTDVRDHSETVTLSTDTKELEQILPQLAPTLEYKAEDGYFGVLTLDVSGITVETAGTKTSSYTATVKREYPHLSSNDTSLVPKTITENGKTYTLASVDWKSQTAETVDYDQIPASYTAVATYTASASKTVVTGYVTTAVYNGVLSKLNQGATAYTAYFAGAEIIPERIPLEIIDPAPSPEASPEAGTEPDSADDPGAVTEEPSAEASPLRVLIPAALLILLLGAGGGYYIPRIIKNMKRKGEPAE